MVRQMKVLIIIPAYNEGENIGNVTKNLCINYPQYDYIVINDGSKDATATICKKNGSPVLDLPVNLGLSGAVQTGFKYAMINHYDAALQFDGDGQHDATYIHPMLQTLVQEDCDIIIGSRFCEKKKPLTARMIGSRLLSFAIKITTRQRITDPTSGMRMYNAKMIERFAQNINYAPEPDTISYLISCGAKIKEVPVKMHERTAGESYLNLSRSFHYMMNMLTSIMFVQFFRRKEELK